MNQKIIKLLSIVLNNTIKICVSIITHLLVFVLSGPQKQKIGKKIESILYSKASKNFIGLTVINGLMGILGALTLVLISNTLGRNLLGTYSFYMAIGGYGTVIVGYGRERTMVRDIIQKPELFHQIVGSSFLLSLIITLLCYICIYLYGFYNGTIFPIEVWLIITCSLMISFTLEPVYDAWREMAQNSYYNLIQKILYIVPLLLIIFIQPRYLNLSVVALVSIFSMSGLIYLQYSELKERTQIIFFTKNNFFSAIHLLKINIIPTLAILTASFLGPATRIFLERAKGVSQVGIFAASFQIVAIIQFMFIQISRIGNPMIATIMMPDSTLRERRIKFGKYFTAIFIINSLFALPIILLPNIVVKNLFTPEFSPVSKILPIMGVYSIIYSSGIVCIQLLQAARLERIYLGGVIVGSFFSIISGFTIIPTYGIVGAAWSLLCAHFLSVLIYIFGVIYVLFYLPNSERTLIAKGLSSPLR